MSVLIRNGEIITANDRYVADIFCDDQTITHIGQRLDAPADAEVIDAAGKFVFPGFIDPHVHIHLPCMGMYAKDDHESASRAALLGGTTTVIEMCNPGRNEDLLEAYSLWKEKAQVGCACDYSFHMGVPRWDAVARQQLEEIIADGINSFKVFLAYKDVFNLDDEALYRVLRFAHEKGVITAAHCENADLIVALQQRLLAEGKTDPSWHYHSRPPYVEAAGTAHLLHVARAAEAVTYIVHLSCRDALQAVLRAREAGVRVFTEAVVPHLVLDRSYAERPDFEGARYVMSPPLRDVAHQETLWNGLRQGFIDTVATDHAPFDFHGQKEKGRGDFTKIPTGIPSIEERIKLLYTYGVLAGRIDLHTLVKAGSTQAARIFGLYPRKGTIRLGSDADLVIFDPKYEGQISHATQAMPVDYSAYEGWPIKGRPDTVLLRGCVTVRGGVYEGRPGQGLFCARDPVYG